MSKPSAPTFLHYDDEPTRRSATVEIWRDCARRAVRWAAFYALLIAVILVLSALGQFQWHLVIT